MMAKSIDVFHAMGDGNRLLVPLVGAPSMVGVDPPSLEIDMDTACDLISSGHICEWQRENVQEIRGWDEANTGSGAPPPAGGWPGHLGKLYRCVQ